MHQSGLPNYFRQDTENGILKKTIYLSEKRDSFSFLNFIHISNMSSSPKKRQKTKFYASSSTLVSEKKSNSRLKRL